jgi:iron complex outermembrane recepter protein
VKMTRQRAGLFARVAATATLASSAVAMAQIEEVVVTAQKRQESLQEVPIAMQAFTGDTLDSLGVSTADDVLNMVPNASLVAQGGSKNNFFIRGVGSADFHANVVGAVGVYLDEVSLNSPFSQTFALFDLERVEVLRGPQNTLFGRNTTGGAVTYISRKPEIGGGFNARGEATYGRFDQMDFEGAVGFDMGANAAGRIALFSNTRDGAFNNLTLGINEGEIERNGGRAQVLWEPRADLSILANVHGGVSRGQGAPFKPVGLRDPSNLANPCPIAPTNQNPRDAVGVCADSNGFVTPPVGSDWEDVFGNQHHREDINTYGGSLKVEWEWRSLTLTSVTSYDYLDVRYNEDSDGSPLTVFQFYQDGEYDQWSQDLRLQSGSDQSIRWMAGFYWFFEEAEYVTTVRRTPAPFAPAAPGSFNILPNTQVYQDNEVFSAYFQTEIDMQEDLTATVGFRWTNETKSGWNIASVRCVGVGGPPFCPPTFEGQIPDFESIRSLPTVLDLGPTKLDGDWTEWGARFALDYQLTEDALLYASISRGFKGGGFSVAALQSILGLGAQPVDPEILWAYEVGGKSTWFDGTLQVNAAVFFYRWDNLQSFQPLLDPVSGIAVPQLLNVPEAELIGFEMDAQWVPDESWFFNVGFGYSDGQITNPGSIASLNAGNEIPGNPKFTFNALGRKEFYIGSGVLGLQVNARFQDSVTYDLLNNPNLTEPSYWNVGVSCGSAGGARS